MTPALLVTVDTEEEGLWNGSFKAHGNTVENTRGIERFQSVCDRYGVRPTYLIDTPVAEDDRSVALLSSIQNAGRCEVGAHLHPWCTPPFEEQTSKRNSYMCNLPERLQREKLTRLTETIERRMERRPTSFRAGRYGIDGTGLRLLAGFGYTVDSSVIPFSDFTAQGGPCFQEASWLPHYVSEVGAGDDGRTQRLLELPVSVGFNRYDFRRAQRIRRVASGPILRRLRAVGILDRTRMVQRIKFSPEQARTSQLKRLMDIYVAQRPPCMVMMLHSSSLVAGGSPYVPDAGRLARLYHAFESSLEYARDRHRMLGLTLCEFAERFAQTSPDKP